MDDLRSWSSSDSDNGAAPLRIRLLGGFQAAFGDRTIAADSWRGSKPAAVVKLLALAPDHRIHREALQELLWPERPTRASANSLHRCLYVARRILEPDVASARRSRVLRLANHWLTLDPGGLVETDVQAFEDAARHAQRSGQVAEIEHALALYSGALLPDDHYADWAAGPRQRLHERYVGLLRNLALCYEQQDALRAAIETHHRILASEPHDEDAHTSLMRLYARDGERGLAIEQYDRLRDVLRRELKSEPHPASQRLYDEILSGRVGPDRDGVDAEAEPANQPGGSPRPAPPHNLPAQATRFIERAHGWKNVVTLLRGHRLVTLTGVGGCGKTRLALVAAERLLAGYPDGVWFVDLAPLSDPRLVAPAVAGALGVREQPGRPIERSIAAFLATRQALLILDNCEHLTEACAEIASNLLAASAGTRILATSRTPLRTPVEIIWQVPPLTVPASEQPHALARLAQFEAVQLLIDRIRGRRPDFQLTEENAPAVVRICERLEGLPLAIELAAGRAHVLSIQQIAARLDDALRLLGSTTPATPRQQTLRAALDWSHDLLNDPERLLFRRLSVFAGGWTLVAAEAVCTGDGIEAVDTLDLLARLVDHSLVVADDQEAETRFRLLEPVRQYANAELLASPERECVLQRHLDWCIVLASSAVSARNSPLEGSWHARLETEHANLRAALEWAAKSDPIALLRLSGDLGGFWGTHGHFSEGRFWLERALSVDDTAPPELRAAACWATGSLALGQGENEYARTRFEESLVIYRDLDDWPGIARTLNRLSLVWWERSDYQRAVDYLEKALAIAREIGDPDEIGRTLHNLGEALFFQGEFELATALQQECLELFQSIGHERGVAVTVHALGLLALECNEDAEAFRLIGDSLRQCQWIGYRVYTAHCLRGLAEVAAVRQQWTRAARLTGAADTLYAAAGGQAAPNQQDRHERYLAPAREHLGADAFDAAVAAGRALPSDRAIAEALDEHATPQPTPSDAPADPRWATLTRRERQIAALLARNLSNREIAATLDINVRTVETHISNVLRKLGLRSRTEVAAWVAAQPPPDR